MIGVTTPPHGIVDFNSSQVFYTPNAGFSGMETITYQLRDDHGLLSTGTLRVWVDTGVLGDQSPSAIEFTAPGTAIHLA